MSLQRPLGRVLLTAAEVPARATQPSERLLAVSTFRSIRVLCVVPLLALIAGCSSNRGRVLNPASAPSEAPEPPEERADEPAPAPEPPVQPAPAPAVLVDKASVVISEANEEFVAGEQHFRAGQMERARAHFDAAVLKFLDSGLDIETDLRLRSAYERILTDIRAIEAEALAEVEDNTPVSETPVEEIEGITSFLTPEETAEEVEKLGEAPEAQEYSIPVVLNEQVLTFIDAFESTPRLREAFQGGYQRMGRYEPMIRKILEEEGVPQDLIYLSFIESTFKPLAYSRAKAKGMWLFMAATGGRYGLKRDYYVDERADPEKATRAAARYLRDLHAMFGDWYLAMAAYNAGEAKVSRAIQRSGRTDFWEIARTRHLRQETKNFVPSILALSIISRDPARSGHPDVAKDPPLQYDWIVLDGPTDLSLIADLAGTTPEKIRELNPHLRRSITPPGMDRYRVRVPAGAGEPFQRAYNALPDGEKIAAVMVRYTVRSGDTLNRIARAHGTTVAALAQANGLTSRSRIYAGSTLLVPRGEGAAAAASAWHRAAAPDPPEAGPDGLYQVHRGDTLSSIARRHGTTVAAIETLNGISRHAPIHPGQRLRVRAVAGAPAGPAPMTANAGTQRLSYTVRRGDNLYAIATRYGTTVERLKSWNNLGRRSRIYPGEVLSIYVD